jgi:hypothetical protein
MIQSSNLSPTGLYGCDRILIRSYQEWVAYRDSEFMQHDYHVRVNVPDYPMGARWSHPEYGYVPIGAFQLWNAASQYDPAHPGIRLRPYPITNNDASRGDIQFGLQWDRRDRHLLPDLICAHLESEQGSLGINWRGRKSKRFAAGRG